jgi:ERCC4-type nuclease
MAETHDANSLPTTILRDTREKRPWTFDSCPVETRDVTLSTGDYAVPRHCTHDPERDTYHPHVAVERKSGQDFLTALTWERDRFERELRRATTWPQPLAVVVETSWETLLRDRGCMARRDVHPAQVTGSVAAWIRQYNVAFHFTETRRRAELCAFLLLVRDSLVRQVDDSSCGDPTQDEVAEPDE